VLQEKTSQRIFLVVTLCVIFLLAGFTRYSATVWADYSSIVEASARKAPTSARAQAQFATQLFNAQRYSESVQVIERAIENIPNRRPLLLRNQLIFRCHMGDLSAQDFEQAAALLSSVPYDARSIEIYTVLASAVIENRCPNVSMDALRAMFANMLQVRQNADPKSLAYSQIQYLIGFVDVHRKMPSQAVAAFEKSLRARSGAGHAMIMAAHLASGEYFDEALHFSDLARSQLEGQSQSFMRGPRVSEADINEFQAVIRADQKRQPAVDTARPVP
jgi:tetratricopeptide (TPR) repeat protein